ncbi:hypothetical protein, partial [Actimicrobium sp. CCI2.3]|uniref:hypothetical protein n=1 Tax=Actimicrobium sp. CCI2.3 TaxID=3048616 RepID=UPI002B246F78
VDALKSQGADAEIEKIPTWSFFELCKIKKKYKNYPDTIYHLQYPSTGMGNSVAPSLLYFLLKRPIFVTLHEFSIFSILRKMIFFTHSLIAKRIIFTNKWESDCFHKYFPFSKNYKTIIPIGNNISVVKNPNPIASKKPKIIYFGQISANKGIEFFIETVSVLRQKNILFDAAFIGSMLDENSLIAHEVYEASKKLKIELILNLPSDDVSIVLGQSTIALLAFPDGITEKRGSALACLDHGLTVLTTHTSKTVSWLRDVTHPIETPIQAASLISHMIDGDVITVRNPLLLEEEMQKRDWRHIALAHVGIYNS